MKLLHSTLSLLGNNMQRWELIFSLFFFFLLLSSCLWFMAEKWMPVFALASIVCALTGSRCVSFRSPSFYMQFLSFSSLTTEPLPSRAMSYRGEGPRWQVRIKNYPTVVYPIGYLRLFLLCRATDRDEEGSHQGYTRLRGGKRERGWKAMRMG